MSESTSRASDINDDTLRAIANAISCGKCNTTTTVDSGQQCSTCGRILCDHCGKRFELCEDHMPKCGHPELIPTAWNQPRPESVTMIGSCRHNLTCPICGFGWGNTSDSCDEVEGFPLDIETLELIKGF